MLKQKSILGSGLFLVIPILMFSYSVLNAAEESKAKVMDEAIMLAQAENKDTAKAPSSVEDRSKYRRELKTIIAEEQPEVEEGLNQQVESYVRYIPSRSAKATSGSVSIVDNATQYNYNFKLAGKLPMQFSLQQEYIGIRNNTNVKLPAHLVGITTYLEATTRFFFDKTYMRIGVSPSFYGDDWRLHSSSFRIPFRSFLIYQYNEKLTLVAGIAVFPQFETMFLPIAGVIYKPNDKLAFNLVPMEPNITYSLNKKIDLFLNGSMSGGEYETNKDNLTKVILQYNETHLGGGATYKFNKYIETTLSTGYMFNRYLKYRDSLGKVSLKNSPYVEFRVNMQM